MSKPQPKVHSGDPILSAIERHRQAYVAEDSACAACDKLNEEEVTPAERRAYGRAVARSNKAMSALLATPPATVTGMRSLLEYCSRPSVRWDIKSEDYRFEAFLRTLLASPALAADVPEGRAS